MSAAYLREKQIPKEYPLTRPWLRKKRREGGGPSYLKLNRMIIYPRSSIEEYLTRHMVKA